MTAPISATSEPAQSATGTVCIAPAPSEPPMRSAPGYSCESGSYSLRIDQQPLMAWSTKESRTISNLDLARPHRVRIYCSGKPHQSFTFRFSEHKANDLCLFLNDLYLTAQLWATRTPWCRCRK